MTPERWAEIQELFHRVVECEPDERTRLLDAAGKRDPELRREVESCFPARAVRTRICGPRCAGQPSASISRW